MKKYYDNDLPLVSHQPPRHSDLVASLLETNASDVTAAQEWEAEWNSQGLHSRLTQEVMIDGETKAAGTQVGAKLMQSFINTA